MDLASSKIRLDGFADTVVAAASALETSWLGVQAGHGHAHLKKDGFDRGRSKPSIICKELMKSQ